MSISSLARIIEIDHDMTQEGNISLIERSGRFERILIRSDLKSKRENYLITFIPSLVNNRNIQGNLGFGGHSFSGFSGGGHSGGGH